jgi:hypothetical protein
MTRRLAAVVLPCLLALPLLEGRASAGPDPHAGHAAPTLPKELEALKKLAGRWEGKAKMGDQEIPVTIVYEVTAGGTAVFEKLFPGQPHEMVSVYVAEGERSDKVVMTHYCAGGNHPKMALKKSDAKGLAFEMTGSEGLRSPKEPHMHAMSVAFLDADHIRESWTSFDGGVKKDEKVFDLTRKK